jgi:hypothetical protein
MNTTLKKTLLAVIPLAGLLLTAPTAFAHSRHHHYQQSYRSHCHPRYNRGWHEGRRFYGNDYYRRSWYNNRRWNDDYYPSRYQRRFPSEPWWWYNSNYR